MIDLFIFRHGQTAWNHEKRLQGHLDISLNEEGIKESLLLAKKLEKANLEIIYSSDLKRAIETSEIVSHHLNIQIIKEKSLRECHFGQAEGMLFEEVIKTFGEELWNDFRVKPADKNDQGFPGGEAPRDVYLRVMNFLSELVQQTSYKRIGIGTHGAVLRNILGPLLPKDYGLLSIPNCVVYHLKWSRIDKTWLFNGEFK